jgi:hypothetical protein
MNFVYSSEFSITRKHKVSENGTDSVFRGDGGKYYIGSLRRG